MRLSDYIGEATAYDKKLMLERKDPVSWLKSVSAFANTQGGRLLFGVANDGSLAGLADAQGDAEFISETIKMQMDSDTGYSTGRHIVEYEQNGEDRAKYGASLINNLVHDLRTRYGRGFSKTNLIYMRKFYLVFRKSQTVSDLLSWSHYMELLRITDKLEMQFYCAECIRSNWNVRELHRQIESALFQRIALSRDRKGVLELARKGNDVRRPEDIYRDSYVLEFSTSFICRTRSNCAMSFPVSLVMADVAPRPTAASCRSEAWNRHEGSIKQSEKGQ